MGVVTSLNFMTKNMLLISSGVGIMIFVYEFMPLIVKLDDIGLW